MQCLELLFLLPVFRPRHDVVSEFDQISVHFVHDLRAHSVVKHVDCYDGQHLRARHRAIRERMGETGKGII